MTVATAGLLLDSPAIVVGAMVIAPQVSAALTASIGTVFNDKQLIIDGFRALVLGLLVAIMLADLLSEIYDADFEEFWENERTATPVRPFAVRLH